MAPVGFDAPSFSFAVNIAPKLTAHPAFDWRNPNRYRAVIGEVSGNHAGYHAVGGECCRLVAGR